MLLVFDLPEAEGELVAGYALLLNIPVIVCFVFCS